MSAEVVSILALIAIFVIATVLPVNMGALALVAAFVVGTAVVGATADDIFAGFPGDLFVILVGVTFLFAIARANGTVDWLVHTAVRLVRGRIALIPWVMFGVTGAITSVGAVVPAAVAIIAPVGMGFAVRYRISPLLMGLMIINGASAGGFSPISIFGVITNGVVARNDLPGSPLTLFLGSLVFNVLLGVVVYLIFGGRELLRRTPADTALVGAGASRIAGGPGAARAATTADTGSDVTEPVTTLDRDRSLTLAGLGALAVGALIFGLDVGLLAITVGVVLSVLAPNKTRGAVADVAWPTVLLICGIVTYVNLMREIGTVDFLGNQVAAIGLPLLAALLICYIGAVVSAFASTTGILGALIPLAVPFLMTGQVGAVGLVTALAISSSVVDSSPFSTSGALVTASAPEEDRDHVFRMLMVWGFSMVAIAPVASWLILVVPGWL